MLNVNIYDLLTPAVIIGTLAFLIRFFGHAITDQKPYCDNRKWDIQLFGVEFVRQFIVFESIVPLVFVLYFKLVINHWFSIILGSVIFAWLTFSNKIFLEKYYRLPFSGSDTTQERDRWKIYDWLRNHNSFLLHTISFILLYILISQIIIGDILWTIYIGSIVFLSFIFVAVQYSYSLQKFKLPIVTIHFTSTERGPVVNARLLKINEDYVRVRNEDKVLLINKNLVSEIEFVISQNNW